MSATPSIRYNRKSESPLVGALKIGGYGSVLALLVSMVGMVVSFNGRFIISGILTTGQALLLLIAMGTGYFAASRANKESASPATIGLYGALAGLVVGGMLALLVLIGSAVNLRDIFTNASPQLYEVLTFDRPLATGAGLLLGFGLLFGFLGSLFYIMPDRIEEALLLGFAVVVLVGMLQDLIRLILNRPSVRGFYDFVFASKGLTLTGALVLFAIPFLAKLGWSAYGSQTRARVERMPATTQKGLRWGALALGTLFLLFLPQIFGTFPSEVMNNVALLGVLMGLGLNIVVGFAGLLDLGYVGFFAIGAYTMALLTSPEVGAFQFTFWQALPFSILVSVLAGIILGIPVLKMRGDYLAIVTLGFGEIIRILVLSDALRPTFNGAQGIVNIPNPRVLGNPLNTPEELYYLILAVVVLSWFISVRLRDSRMGRAWMAIREDEDVAEAMGIDLVVTKLLAFGTGAAMAGLGGAIFASKLQSIVPQTFNLLISVNALSIIIIGGLGSIPGVVVGALLLIGLPELLREFNEYRLWLYGALLVVMMLYKPEGFWPEETHKRELHGHENPELPDSATIEGDLLVNRATPGINDPVVSGGGASTDGMKE